MSREQREETRMRDENRRRRATIPYDFYSPSKPANLFLRQGQERALLDALRRGGLLPLESRRILEVGCGTGRWLTLFETFGAHRKRLAGIELESDRVRLARARMAGADVREGNAVHLPWNGETFDIVLQSTVFTSVLDDEVRARMAREMLRVLHPEGAIVWYDFRYDNPRNPNVKGIGRRQIARLFPDCRITSRWTTLAPPVARRVVPHAWLLAALLESVRLFNSHCMCVIRKQPNEPLATHPPQTQR